LSSGKTQSSALQRGGEVFEANKINLKIGIQNLTQILARQSWRYFWIEKF
jgi:hypothetical protein